MKREDIIHLATLARIELQEAEIQSFADDITEILEYVSEVSSITAEEKKKEVDVLYNVMREDEPSHAPDEYTEAILSATVSRSGRYFKVKKILGEES